MEHQILANEPGSPHVFIVATPIGNLEDLTPRARRTLSDVAIIAAEDTRHARKLLAHLDIHGKRLVSYQDHGEADRAGALIAQLQTEGLSLAVITDAGTPCISDPGYRIVAAAYAAGIKVTPIPGVSALTTLVSASGLPSDRVLFIGFLPNRSGPLQAEIKSWGSLRASVVFFESTRRLARTLVSVREVYPGARVAIGRELTKMFEEIISTDIASALDWLNAHATLKGEVSVMVMPGAAPSEAADSLAAEQLIAEARKAFSRGETLRDLLRRYKDSGFKRPDLYNLLLTAKDRG